MKGSCLCGSVEISTSDHHEVNVCHCSMCRRWGGGPLFAVHCGSDVEFGGTIEPASYRSSDWAERGFCPSCGTHLFYHVLSSDEYILPAGIFQDTDEFKLVNQIFIDEKPAYYEFANQTKTMTGEQVFAQFSDGES